VIRSAEGWWVPAGKRGVPVDAELPSTAALLTNGVGAVHATASAGAGGVPAERLSLLSPVTTPCRVVAQAVNYRWRVFFSRQERNPAYLKAGDVVTASIATEDETLDLGAQRIVVRDER
jgi:hypothetical protein